MKVDEETSGIELTEEEVEELKKEMDDLFGFIMNNTVYGEVVRENIKEEYEERQKQKEEKG